MTTLNHHTPAPLAAALGASTTTPTKHAAEVPAPTRPITHPNETPTAADLDGAERTRTPRRAPRREDAR